MGLKPTDYVVLILLGIICVVLIGFMIMNAVKTKIEVEAPKEGELARFIRYMGCSIVLCTKGCGSDELYTHALEYEGNKVVKSCKQLIDEFHYCDGRNGAKLCGKDYAINFTFKEDVTYHGDYNIETFKPETYGTCGIGKTGWQTDVSCIGGWYDNNMIAKPCIKCSSAKEFVIRLQIVPPITIYVDKRPEGKLVYSINLCERTDAGTGNIWIPQNWADKCEPKYTPTDDYKNALLKSCRFDSGDEIWIWTENVGQVWATFIPYTDWCVLWAPVDCHSIILCDSKP